MKKSQLKKIIKEEISSTLKEEPHWRDKIDKEDAITDLIMGEFGKIAITSTLTMDQKTVLDNNNYQSFISALKNLEILAKKYYKA